MTLRSLHRLGATHVLVWVATLSSLSIAPLAAQSGPESLRTLEVLRMSCKSDLTLEDVTFFGNGTVRLFERLGEEEERNMLLTELRTVEREVFYERVAELDLEEADTFGGGIDGEFLDQCVLSRRLVGEGAALSLRFHRLDSLSIGLQRAVDLAGELIGLVRDRAPFSGIPDGYQPAVGDFLRKPRVGLYEIVGFAHDASGVENVVELVGIEEPLRIYVPIAQLREIFVSVEHELP